MRYGSMGGWGIVLALAMWCGGLRGPAFAEGPTVVAGVDCREGVGLVPGFWRGISWGGGEVPEGLELRAVCLAPRLIEAAWRGRLSGDGGDWSALDAALDALDALGVDAILPLPAYAGVGADAWPGLVSETVRRAGGRASRFEIRAGVDGRERYLQFYESGVWAVYRADPKAHVGGPGMDWKSGGVEALVARCRDRNLPLHFVSWEVKADRPEALMRSVEAARGILDRHALPDRPRLLIGGWRSASDSSTADPMALALSSLLSILGADLDALCMEAPEDGEGMAALRAFGRLERVQLPMTVGPSGSGIEGIASGEGDAVTALFWSRSGAAASVAVSFEGLPWGRQVRIRRYRLGVGEPGTEPIEERAVPMRDPLRVAVPLMPRHVAVVRLLVED